MQSSAKVMGVLGQITEDEMYGILEPEHCILLCHLPG